MNVGECDKQGQSTLRSQIDLKGAVLMQVHLAPVEEGHEMWFLSTKP